MPRSNGSIGGIGLVRTSFGDFFIPEDATVRAEIRETGGQARWGLAALSSRLGPGDTVIDLGAGVGLLSVPLQRAVGSSGRIWCFEPDPGMFTLLRWNLAVNGVDLPARAVAAGKWPRLDDWCRAQEIERLNAIRVHGLPAAAALAEGGLNTLATHRPLILFTRAFDSAVSAWDSTPLQSHLPQLGYVFDFPTATVAEEEPDQIEPALLQQLQAAPVEGSVLAVPADPGAGAVGDE